MLIYLRARTCLILQTIVPFQCSLAEASKTLDRLSWIPQTDKSAASHEDIETVSLGEFANDDLFADCYCCCTAVLNNYGESRT